jgi:hypothetical protein
MPKLVPVFMAVALAASMGLATAAPYEMAARHREINRTPAVEVFKNAAKADAMFEALDQPTMPPGMTITLGGETWRRKARLN